LLTVQPMERRGQIPIVAMFEIEREGETIIFTPVTNLSELHDLASKAKGVVDVLSDASIKNLVMDFHKTDYFGGSALALFVKVWKMMTHRNGCLAFCNLSEHEHEILSVTKLDKLWPICESRAEAMKVVGN
jgi:anti-anti-sigma factor